MNKNKVSIVCRYMLIILALWRLRQKDHEFEASMDYIVRHYLRKQTKRPGLRSSQARYP